jgi:hypothetical protein
MSNIRIIKIQNLLKAQGSHNCEFKKRKGDNHASEESKVEVLGLKDYTGGVSSE